MSDTILSKLPMSLQTLPERFDEERLLANAPVFSLGVLSSVPDALVRDPGAFARLHKDAVARYRKEIAADPKLCALIEKFSAEEAFIKKLVLISPVLAVRDAHLEKLERQFKQILLARKMITEKTGETFEPAPEPPFPAETLPETLLDLDSDLFPEVLRGMFGAVSDPAKAELTKSIPLDELTEPDESVVATNLYYDYDAMYRAALTKIAPAHEQRIAEIIREKTDAEAERDRTRDAVGDLQKKLDRIATFEREIETLKTAYPETMREEVGKRAMTAALNEQKIIRPPVPDGLKEKSFCILKAFDIRKKKDAFNNVLRKIFGSGLKSLLSEKERLESDFDAAAVALEQNEVLAEKCEQSLQEEKAAYAAEAFAIKKDFNASLKARLAMVLAARDLTPPEDAATKVKLPPILEIKALTGDVFIELPVSLPVDGVRRAADILTETGIPTASSRAYINPDKWALLAKDDGAVLLSPPTPVEKAPDSFVNVLKILRDTCGSAISSPVIPLPLSVLLPPVDAEKSLTSVKDQMIAANIDDDKETLRLVSMTPEEIRDEIMAAQQETAMSYEDFMIVTEGCAFRKTDFLSSDAKAAFVSDPAGRIPLSLSVAPFMPEKGERCFVAAYAVDPKSAFMPTENGRYGVFAIPRLTPFKSFWLIDDKGFTLLTSDTKIKTAALDSYAPTQRYFLSRYPEWHKKTNF